MLGKSERNNPYAHTAKHIERKSRFVISSQSRIDTGPSGFMMTSKSQAIAVVLNITVAPRPGVTA